MGQWLRLVFKPLLIIQDCKDPVHFTDIYFETVTFKDNYFIELSNVLGTSRKLIKALVLLADLLEIVSPAGRANPMLLTKHPKVTRLLPEVL